MAERRPIAHIGNGTLSELPSGDVLPLAVGGTGAGTAAGARAALMVVGIATTAPADPGAGGFWWESTTGTLYVRFNDGDTTQWVEVAGQTGPTGANGADGATGATGPASPRGVCVPNPTSAESVTLFYTTAGLTLSKVKAVLTGSATPSVTYSLKSGSDRASATETHVNAATVTSTTTGTDATLADATITAGRWVWLETSAMSGTVTSLAVSLEF